MKHARTHDSRRRSKGAPAKPASVDRRYIIRNVPRGIDVALRSMARRRKKSINQAALDALAAGLGLQGGNPRYHDLDFVAGTWADDPEFDRAIQAQRQIDREMWR